MSGRLPHTANGARPHPARGRLPGLPVVRPAAWVVSPSRAAPAHGTPDSGQPVADGPRAVSAAH